MGLFRWNLNGHDVYGFGTGGRTYDGWRGRLHGAFEGRTLRCRRLTLLRRHGCVMLNGNLFRWCLAEQFRECSFLALPTSIDEKPIEDDQLLEKSVVGQNAWARFDNVNETLLEGHIVRAHEIADDNGRRSTRRRASVESVHRWCLPLAVTAVNENSRFGSFGVVDEREGLIERAQDVLSVVIAKVNRQRAHVAGVVRADFDVAYGHVKDVTNAQRRQPIDIVR